MLLPHPGRPGVQCWDQRSLVTFALTGAVQPLTCCMVEFPPLGCTGRNLLPIDHHFLFLSGHWTGRRGEEGICQSKKESHCSLHFAAVPQQHRLQKKLHWSPPGRVWMQGVRKAGEPVPAFFSHSTTGPAKPTKS